MTLSPDIWNCMKRQPHRVPRVGRLYQRSGILMCTAWEERYNTLIEARNLVRDDFFLCTGVYYQHLKVWTIYGQYFVPRLKQCVYFAHVHEEALMLVSAGNFP